MALDPFKKAYKKASTGTYTEMSQTAEKATGKAVYFRRAYQHGNWKAGWLSRIYVTCNPPTHPLAYIHSTSNPFSSQSEFRVVFLKPETPTRHPHSLKKRTKRLKKYFNIIGVQLSSPLTSFNLRYPNTIETTWRQLMFVKVARQIRRPR